MRLAVTFVASWICPCTTTAESALTTAVSGSDVTVTSGAWVSRMTVRTELDRMTREPVTERELDLAKAYLIGSFPFRLDTSSKVADFLVAIESQGLGLDYADRYRAGVASVKAADVQRVAATFFPPDQFSRVIVGKTP